jgi:hypothetical protein
MKTCNFRVTGLRTRKVEWFWSCRPCLWVPPSKKISSLTATQPHISDLILIHTTHSLGLSTGRLPHLPRGRGLPTTVPHLPPPSPSNCVTSPISRYISIFPFSIQGWPDLDAAVSPRGRAGSTGLDARRIEMRSWQVAAAMGARSAQ